VQKGESVVVVFFGQHPVRGIVDTIDKAKVMIAFGQGTWTVTAPRDWIRQREDDLVIDLG
jgi:hypothetical protein